MSWIVSKLANVVVGGSAPAALTKGALDSEIDKENCLPASQVLTPVKQTLTDNSGPKTRQLPSPGMKPMQQELEEIEHELEQLQHDQVQEQEEPDLSGDLVAEVDGSLFLMSEKGELDLREENVALQLYNCAAFSFQVRVWSRQRQAFVLAQPLSTSMQISFEKKPEAMCWISFFGAVRVWRFEMKGEAGVGGVFKLRVAQCLVEASQQESFSKVVAKGDHDWVCGAHEEEEEEEEEEEHQEDEDEDSSPQREEFAFDPRPHNESPSKLEKAVKGFCNNNLNVGMTSNRTFVFRGDHLGVYTHNQEEEMEYVTQVDNIQDKDKRPLAPTTTMLHQRDSKMLMLNQNRPDAVSVLDLETGKVVDEWQARENFTVRNLAPHSKYSQRTSDQLFAAVSRNGLFLVDPRIGSKDKIAQNYFYKEAPKFTCMATNQEGHMVVGSDTGDIRLFSSVLQKGGKDIVRSKTKLPSLGDGVVGIDVTADGKWILATTKNYLLVICTAILGDDKRRTGFQAAMPMDKRSKPIKLQLRYQDLLHYAIGDVNFTPATFNTGEGTDEEWIVTSTGPHIITWNFRKVQQGVRDHYQIKRTSSDVVQSKFRYNKEDQVVVNLPNDVYMEKRTKTHVTSKASP